MKFRYARHTNDLHQIEKFYTDIIGLEKLGGFENHDYYNGIFLGFPQQDWHLEFTTSDDQTQSRFDEDDILVFYLSTVEELAAIKNRLIKNNIPLETSKNPYWNENGIQVSDPDGYKVIFSQR
jgi:catechol-2,3-dioxygenase